MDEEQEALDRFRRAHPTTPPSARLTDQTALEGWINGLGLDRGATLPIHVFIDPQGRVRCARSGAVTQNDYELVRHLVSEP